MNARISFIVAGLCFAIGSGLALLSFTVRNDAIGWYSRSGLVLFIIGGVLVRRGIRLRATASIVNWYDATEKYHELTSAQEGRLSSLPTEWQRELAALWRLEADVNNGAYLQFIQNWGRESYTFASQALKKIGALRMAEIVDRCQALVDEHFDSQGKPPEEKRHLMPNPVIDQEGNLIKKDESVLPESIHFRITELSFEFMAYPEDIATLGLNYYRAHIEGDT